MGLIDDVVAEEAQWQISADLHFGESVTYCPQTGASRTITAIVDRNPIGAMAESAKVRAYRIRIAVRNDSTYGVGSDETTMLRGTFTIAKRVGHSETETFTIAADSLVAQDAGTLTFAWE